MIDHFYIRVSNDEYEHVIAVADTAKELAEICNTSVDVIYSSVSHNVGSYRKIYMEEGRVS
jgi:HD superfamily phosphohydrolase YqeK